MKHEHRTNFLLAILAAIFGGLLNLWMHGDPFGAQIAAVFTLFFSWGFNYAVDWFKYHWSEGWRQRAPLPAQQFFIKHGWVFSSISVVWLLVLIIIVVVSVLAGAESFWVVLATGAAYVTVVWVVSMVAYGGWALRDWLKRPDDSQKDTTP